MIQTCNPAHSLYSNTPANIYQSAWSSHLLNGGIIFWPRNNRVFTFSGNTSPLPPPCSLTSSASPSPDLDLNCSLYESALNQPWQTQTLTVTKPLLYVIELKTAVRTNSQPMRTRAVCRITSHPRAVINLYDYMQSIGGSCWIYYYYRTSVTKWTWNIYKLHKDGIYRLPFTECMQLWVTHLGQRWSSEMLFSFFGLFIAWSSKKVKGDFHSSLCKPKSDTLVAPWWSQ